MRQHAGVCRLVYNLALEQRRTWGKSHGLNNARQQLDLKPLRAEFDWIAAVSSTALVQAMNDLDKAFGNFFAGRAEFPRPRKKGENDSFRFVGREVSVRRLNKKWSEVRLPKMGWVRFRDTRPLNGDIRNATVSLTPLGWHISIMCRTEVKAPARLPESVGIDRGVAVPVMLSTGEGYLLPPSLEKLDRMHRRAQRVAARRKRGSKRYAKAQRRAAKIKSKAARVRAHWQHELTTSIANRFGVVVLEKLKTKNMTRSAKGTAEKPGKNVAAKSGLNRSILNVGWFGIETKLAYKLAERAGELVKVNPAYTSQTCSCCGTVDAGSRESQSAFNCLHCGFQMNADQNAAINIKRRWNAPLLGVEVSALEPTYEAPTISVAA